jgi:hypothetical protein
MRNTTVSFVVCVITGVAFAGCASYPTASVPLERSEVDITQSELPRPALSSLRARAGKRAFTAIEREDRGLYLAYEAEWQDGPIEAEATVLADGGVLEEERELTPNQLDTLPPAVLERIRSLQSQGYDVQVARRTVYLFDIDVTRAPQDGDDEAEEGELLLRPDGSDATHVPR